MKTRLTSEERLERLRLLWERLELEKLDIKTPAQMKRLANIESQLESTRTARRNLPRGATAPAAAAAGPAVNAKAQPQAAKAGGGKGNRAA
jgi:hypothetical protein